jgi:hypothetical protein
MAAKRNSANLAVLAWPVFSWVAGWQAMATGLGTSAAPKPSRKRGPRKPRRRQAIILRFPVERIVRRAHGSLTVNDAEIIRLPELA